MDWAKDDGDDSFTGFDIRWKQNKYTIELGPKTVLASGDGSTARTVDITDMTDTTLDSRPVACCRLTGKLYAVDIAAAEGERLVELVDLSTGCADATPFSPTWIDVNSNGGLIIGGTGRADGDGVGAGPAMWVKTIDKTWTVTSEGERTVIKFHCIFLVCVHRLPVPEMVHRSQQTTGPTQSMTPCTARPA